ncbi:hypothetical protein GCM10010377_74440 [Streptomyces viridiviolaceus]|nr:hypothetical protein GCM10010377_74440 [Streptomyces viridiviolaceus]
MWKRRARPTMESSDAGEATSMSDATITGRYELTMTMPCLREGMTGPAAFSLLVGERLRLGPAPTEEGSGALPGLRSPDGASGIRGTEHARRGPRPSNSDGPYRGKERTDATCG